MKKFWNELNGQQEIGYINYGRTIQWYTVSLQSKMRYAY